MEARATGLDSVNDSTASGPAEPPAARVLAWADRHRRWLLAAVLLLYAAGFTGKWRVNPDSSLYMALGRNLAEGNGFTYHGVPHTRAEPGLPGVIAGSFRLFGVDNYAPILVFTLLCSLTGLLLTYRLMRLHAGRPTAVLVTALLAACETYLRYAFQIVTDTPFLVTVLIFLLAYERLVGGGGGGARDRDGQSPGGTAEPTRTTRRGGAWEWLAWPTLVVAMLLMVTFRPAAVTFVGAVGLATAWHLFRGPHRLRHVLIGLLTLTCFVGFRLLDPRRAEAGQAVYREERLRDLLTVQRSYAIERLFTGDATIPSFFEEIVPEAIVSWELGPGIDTAFTLIVLAAGLALARRRVLWGAWVLATSVQCMFWLPRERYLLPILPLLIYGLWRGAAWVTSRPGLSPRAARAILAGMLLLYLGPNLGHDVWFAVEQRLVGIHGSGRGDAEFAPYLEMARRIRDTAGDEDVVLADDHHELSYFSRRRVEGSLWSFRWPPTPERERRFHKQLKTARTLYAVLPDGTKDRDVSNLIEALGMRAGPPIVTVPRPDRRGKPRPPLTLHRLLPRGPLTTAPVRRPSDPSQ